MTALLSLKQKMQHSMKMGIFMKTDFLALLCRRQDASRAKRPRRARSQRRGRPVNKRRVQSGAKVGRGEACLAATTLGTRS